MSLDKNTVLSSICVIFCAGVRWLVSRALDKIYADNE